MCQLTANWLWCRRHHGCLAQRSGRSANGGGRVSCKSTRLIVGCERRASGASVTDKAELSSLLVKLRWQRTEKILRA